MSAASISTASTPLARARRATISGELSMPSTVGAALDDLARQRPLAAADVEDPLARLRVEQVERRPAELGDERRRRLA